MQDYCAVQAMSIIACASMENAKKNPALLVLQC